MHPQTDGPLRSMPLVTKLDAVAYVNTCRDWLYANAATGNGAFLGATSKPSTLCSLDLFAKAAAAFELSEMT